MVAEAGTAPCLEAADLDAAPADQVLRQENIVDVIGRTILGAVAPVEGRHALLAVLLAAQRVPGADQAEALVEQPHLGRVVDAPARLVPDRVAVEIARDQRGAVAEESLVAHHRPPQWPELVLAMDAAAGVLRPHRQQVERQGAGHMHRRDVTQRRVVPLAEPRLVAVEGEDGEPLVRVGADPDRLALQPLDASGLEPRRLGAFADDSYVRFQGQQSLDLAVEGHVAIPGDDPHSPCPRSVPALRDSRKNHWKIWKPITR